MKVKITHIMENLAGVLLVSWAVFQVFYFLKYGYETEFGYYLNIAGPALFSIWFLTIAIKHVAEKDFKPFFFYLIFAVFIAVISVPFVL
jgi:hypothetical protein